MRQTFETKNMVYAGLFVALAMVLPFFTGNIPQIGKMLCPMHIPILFCGMMCGAKYGAMAGFVSPLLRSAVFHAPVMYPSAVAMAVELMVYGLVAGFLYKHLDKTIRNLYSSLISAMIAGRLVWGVVMFAMMVGSGEGFTIAAFLSATFFSSIPGIVLQIILIPTVMLALKRADYGFGAKRTKEIK